MTKRRTKQVKAKKEQYVEKFQRNLSVIGKTYNQKQVIKLINANKVTFVHGPAGTGKTHIATALGVIGLIKGDYSRLIITRPLVQSGEDTGFLPGDIKKKLDPYMRPIYDELHQYVSYTELQTLFNSEKIEICPFAYMRGRNFHNCFIIADECQNASYSQIKMLLTRIGKESKMVLTGDSMQSDLPNHKRGGFEEYTRIMGNVPNVGVFSLDRSDIVREQVVEDMIKAMEEYEKATHKNSGLEC